MSRLIDDFSYAEGWNAGMLQGRDTKEQLGQELDRWQLIARDLIEEMQNHIAKEEMLEWIHEVAEELSQMPEMRFEW